jgi:hypothetical protein
MSYVTPYGLVKFHRRFGGTDYFPSDHKDVGRELSADSRQPTQPTVMPLLCYNAMLLFTDPYSNVPSILQD